MKLKSSGGGIFNEQKKKKTIFAVCAAAVIVIGFLIYFLMWGIILPRKTIYFLDNKVELKYERKKRYNGIVSVIYKDAEGNEYTFNRNGKLTGYYDMADGADFPASGGGGIQPADGTDEALMAALEQKARAVFEELIIDKSRSSQYEFRTEGIFTSYGECIFSFVKKINGFNTNDTLSIGLDRNGMVKSYIGNRQGLFDELVVDTAVSDVEQFVKEKVNSKHPGAKYEMDGMTIDRKNSKFFINCYVVVETEEHILAETYEYKLE